ncbi:uncharacterized protein LOC127283352 [Leptopilina boulardi]|uniref:uncharacterized protein LOC127283352 n=1 Tax=Leptopilina boulardi TaxID=63433 RepID=UPI0021F61EC7|nr:uncharacterized protein LOC127283352 [Leptopilina boulardi]
MNFTIKSGIMKGKEKTIELGNVNLGKLLLDTLKSKPNFVGQIDAITGEKINYGQMAEKSVQCGIWFKKNGLNFNDIVFTCCQNRIDTYIPIFATFYNGATFAFGHKGILPQRTRYLFGLLKPKFIITEEEEVKLFAEIAKEEKLNVKIVTFTKVTGYYYLEDILKESNSNEVLKFISLPPLNPNDDCVLPLTSGTTGDSKILAHSYKSIMEGLLINNSQIEIIKNDISLIHFPLYWVIALRIMLGDILNFTTRILVNETNHDLHDAFKLIQKYKVTKVRFTLGMIYRLFKWNEIEKYDTSSIKMITFSGCKLPPEIFKFLIKVFKNSIVEQIYGSTEMTIPMCRGIMNKINLNSCGYLYPNMSMKIIDIKSGEILGPNKSGEICFKSRHLMKGYYKNPTATKNAIDSEEWYHTGDLGFYDDNGLVFFQGRVKGNTIKLNGEIVPLWLIERALICNSEVLEACALSDGDENFTNLKIIAFVVLLPGSQITENELSEIIKNFTDIKLPITVKIVDSMPVTYNGKIKTSELLMQIKNK